MGQRLDLNVQMLPDTNGTSLARGKLWQTDLRINGANAFNPRDNVTIYASGQGPVFVNPAHLIGQASQGTAKASLRSGTVLGGGVASNDRPLILRIRDPQRSMARGIEGRVKLQFPKNDEDPTPHAAAFDEGMVYLTVPLSFAGDWEHFQGIVMHLYLDATAGNSAEKAKQLVAEAVKPEAPLEDISFCWEGLGKPSLDYIPVLYHHASADVAYAACRAGAFLGDNEAQQVLLNIAHNDQSPFQLNAVKTLGQMPTTPRIDHMLAQLLDSPNSLVRVESWRILTQHPNNYRIQSTVVRQAFVMDVVPSKGPPLIYATRVGMPRVVLFGDCTKIKTPIIFTAMDSRLSITGGEQAGTPVSIFYRGEELLKPIRAELTEPDLKEVIYRLGGGSEDGFRFSYADILSILEAMTQRQQVAATFSLQDMPRVRDFINDAPVIPVRGELVAPAGTLAPTTAPSASNLAPLNASSIGVRP